jgi:hypothetical protein
MSDRGKCYEKIKLGKRTGKLGVVLFFFFFEVLRLELRALTFSHSTCSFCEGFFSS